MQKLHFDHVHFYSPDPEKTAEFYVQMLGAEKLEVRQESEEHTVVVLKLDGIRIIVSTPWDADSDSYGLDHFGMTTDDLDGAIAELKSNPAGRLK